MKKLFKKKPKNAPELGKIEPSGGMDVPIRRTKRKSVRKWVKRIIKILLLAALIYGIVMFVRFKLGRKAEAPVQQTTSVVTRGGFESRITGSGTVQPIESYTLTSLVTGTITECDFDAGQAVSEGDVLYRFEDTDAQTKIKSAQTAVNDAERDVESADKTIERAAKSVTQAKQDIVDALEDIDDVKERIAKLTVTAPVSGMIQELSAEVGDSVSGTLCSVLDYNNTSTTVSFNVNDIAKISVGDKAAVGSVGLMTSVGGYVDKIYTAPHYNTDGSITQNVKIRLDDGAGLVEGTNVSVTVHTASGDIDAPTTGTLAYAAAKAVKLDESGEIAALYAEEGNYITKGEVIAILSSEDLENELKSARDAYQDKLDALEDAEDSYNDALSSRESRLDAVETAKAELENVMNDAENYVITSPVTGVVLEKYYKKGDTFGNDDSNKNLMVVADMSKMVFTINVDELDIANIHEGQAVNITADALPGEMMSGTITSASKIGNAENGVTGYPIEITIDEPGNLMSGMNVTAEIVVGSVEDALIAPASAIFLIDGAYYATIVTPPENEGAPETEEQVAINVGLYNDEFYEIIDGLEEGDVLRDSGIGSASDDEDYGIYW